MEQSVLQANHLKGIVHPKMSVLSSFTLPPVWHSLVVVLFHKVKVNGGSVLFWTPLTFIVWAKIFKIFQESFMFLRSHMGLEWHEGKWWWILNFWVNCPFNSLMHISNSDHSFWLLGHNWLCFLLCGSASRGLPGRRAGSYCKTGERRNGEARH